MNRRAVIAVSALAVGASMLLTGSPAFAQAKYLSTYALGAQTGQVTATIPSNSVSHISIQGASLWIGTGKGLARSTDAGRTWESFGSVPQFASKGIFAIALRGDSIWTSTGFSKDVDNQSVQTGSGYTYSTDMGSSWSNRPQPLDPIGDSSVTYGANTVKFLPIVVNEQNVTYDISLSDGTVWIASWSSGIRKSTDLGATWQRIVLPSDIRSSIAPTDTLPGYKIDPRQDNNFLGFAVYAQDNDTIWAGTAGGINRSVDGGRSWAKFTRDTQTEHILSDWVITITGQRIGSRTRIWTTNWPAEGEGQEYGISMSDDGGRTWKNFLHGIKAYDFAFKDSTVYVAADGGMFSTTDGGNTWRRSGDIIDETTRERITENQFLSVGVLGDTVYCGSSEGLVKTVDTPSQPFGSVWTILRAFEPLPSRTSAYAYPNPFSPRLETIRIHYATERPQSSVTLEIFDFGMNRMRTVVRNAQRSTSGEHDERWNGRTDSGDLVKNGVYFYRVTIDDGEPVWGKIMVLQ